MEEEEKKREEEKKKEGWRAILKEAGKALEALLKVLV